MGVIGAILGILMAIGVWYWRAQTAVRGARAAADAIGTARGAYNRRKFRKQSEGSVLANIEGPGEAAAVLLTVIASENGPVSQTTEDLIAAMLSDRAGLQGRALEDAMSFAKWAAEEVADGNDVVRKLLPVWRRSLNEDERLELVAMARTVAEADGQAAPVQLALVKRLSEGL